MLTSLTKPAQIITGLPGVAKVVFCVDRKDPDYQTRLAAFERLCKEEQLDPEKLKKVIDRYGNLAATGPG